MKLKRENFSILPFDYEGVQLLAGRLKDQFKQVRDFYYDIPNDSILKDFRLEAGLPAPGKLLGGTGTNQVKHPTLGQWLSAFARMYKATGDTAVRDKAVYLMDEWAKTISDERPPKHHYAYEKMVSGLVDMYEYIGSENALQYLERITDWAERSLDRTQPYVRGGEWYTLSENLYRAYELTGEKRYFDFAKVWEYTDYWGLFARGEDIFQDILKTSQGKHYHAYSHVNTFSGAAMAYRVTGERHYLDTIINAYQYLQDTQCYATGGYGPEEQLIVPDGLPETIRATHRGAEILKPIRRGESNVGIRYHFETACGSWAAFKLTHYLMTFTGEARYGDWVERLIYNGVSALIPMNKYGMIMYGSNYHLYGAYKSQFARWFCCTGTLPIAVTDYHNLIYFHDAENLYVNLFVPSKVEWKGPTGMVTVVQDTRFPEKDTVLLHVQPKVSSRFGLKFRVPQWARNGIKVKVNNVTSKIETIPGKWATIERKWNENDTVTLQFDLSPRIEPLTGYVSPIAILSGPVVLVTTTDPRGIPIDRDLRYPAGWLPSKAWISVLRPYYEKRVLRPYYKIKAGEYYRMYFERPGGISISPNELAFHGSWFSDETIRYAQESGSYFEGKFKGTIVVWEGMRHEDAGIAKVSIDGKEIADVDQYGYTDVHSLRGGPWGPSTEGDDMRFAYLDQREVPFRWSISDLDEGEHTIKVTISLLKNPASHGTKINVRRLLSYPE